MKRGKKLLRGHSNPKWAGADGKFSFQKYQAVQCATNPKWIQTKIFNQQLYKARKSGDKEFIAAMEAALRSAGGKKFLVDVDAVRRTLKRGRYKDHSLGFTPQQVFRKVRVAKAMKVPESRLLTPAEAKWLKNDRKAHRRWQDKQTPKDRRASRNRFLRKFKRTDDYRRSRQFDNTLQRARHNEDRELEMALLAAHLAAGRSWDVDVGRVYRSIGRTPSSRFGNN